MTSFFLHPKYPLAIVEGALKHVNNISHEIALWTSDDGQSNKQVIPLILMYYLINCQLFPITFPCLNPILNQIAKKKKNFYTESS